MALHRWLGLAVFGSVALGLGCGVSSVQPGTDGGAGTDGDAVDPDAAPDDDSGIPVPTNAAMPEGLTISEISGFQTVKVPIMKNGVATAGKAPLVADKDALLRVYVALDAGWTTHNVVGLLDVTVGGTPTTLKAIISASASSTDDAIYSTLNFKLPPSLVTPDATFKVRVVEQTLTAPPSDQPSPTRYPQDGVSDTSMGVKSSGAQLKIVLVPIKYTADGSGRLPDTGGTQMAGYKTTMTELYPVPDVVFTLHAPVSWGSIVSANGSGWGNLLQMLLSLRQQEGAAPDKYYYGAFEPASSFAAFCGGGCVAGLSTLSQAPSDAWARASIGLGFSGLEAAFTMAHEVGHAHGRNHSPCGGAQGVDPNYPYAGASIGVWGYSMPDQALIAPTKGKDIMGYCQPQWISDYTYGAIFTRIKTVNGASWIPGPARGYRWASVDEKGEVTLGARFTSPWPPGGQEATFGGVKGWYYPYDHLPGGLLAVPD